MSVNFSSSDVINEDQTSEFWNRDDEECSEEDISDSDGIFFTTQFSFYFFWERKGGFKEHCKFMYLIHCLRQIADGLAAKNLARSKLPAKLGFNEKIECLQRLEERYYKDKSSDKQVRSD